MQRGDMSLGGELCTDAKSDFSGSQNLKSWTFGNLQGTTKIEQSLFFFIPFLFPSPLFLGDFLHPKNTKKGIFQSSHETLSKILVGISHSCVKTTTTLN